jgi:hypothetical protein
MVQSTETSLLAVTLVGTKHKLCLGDQQMSQFDAEQRRLYWQYLSLMDMGDTNSKKIADALFESLK